MQKIKSWLGIVFICLLIIPLAMADDTVGISGTAISTTSTSLNAPDKWSSLRILQTKYDPSPAEPGNRLTLFISLQNWGNGDIDDAYFQIDPTYPFLLEPGSDGIISSGRIPGFRDVLLEYDLVVDENAIEGTYKIPVRQCNDETCDSWFRTVRLDVTVKTGGVALVEAGLEDFEIFTGGKTGIITLNLINRDKLDANFVMLTLLPSDKYEIISPSRLYIGELESDDFDTADFKIYVTGDVAKKESEEIILPIKLEYSDSNYRKYTEYQDLTFKVYSSSDLKKMQLVEQGGSSWMTIIVVIILGGAGYWYYRRRKKKLSS